MFTKEVIINQLPEEEIYFSSELIDENEFINLGDLINDNGGLLSIPELFNTDITFYIIRYWGRKILKILNILHQNNVCVKYITLNDLYVSRDGREIKIRNLEHLSCFNKSGKIFYGPDLNIILCFYRNYFNTENNNFEPNKKTNELYKSTENLSESKANNKINNNINVNNNEFNNDNININFNYDIEKKLHYTKLDFIDYNDPYIAPDYMIKDPKELTSKIDTWIFGSILFHILYGQPPHCFILQLKEWCDNQTNLIFEKINFPFDIASKHFFYNPFKKNIDLNTNKDSYLNTEGESNDIGQSTLDSSRNLTRGNYNLFNSHMTKNKNNIISNFKSFIAENKNLIEATKMNSYSATVNEKYLNPETETNKNINGLGIVLDMIASCLELQDYKRPDIEKLIQSDLFKFDNYEMVLVNKFAYNTLRYLSPDAIILKRILIPLREVKNHFIICFY